MAGRLHMSAGEFNRLLLSIEGVNNLTPATTSAAKDLDVLNTKVGLTTTELQKLSAISQQAAATVAGSMGKMTTEATIASRAISSAFAGGGVSGYERYNVWPKQAAAIKQVSSEYAQLANYVKRAAVAFAAFKALDVARDLVTGSIEATKNIENFSNALNAALPAGESFNQTMTAMAGVTRGIIPQWQQMQMATQLYASELADTADEAAKLANAGVILTTVFKGQNATWDRYFRLLQGGSKMLYDNFNLSKAMVDEKTQEIQATEGLSLSEARLKAVRQLVIAQGAKFKDSLGELTTASMLLDASWQDYLATLGQTGPWAEAQRGAASFLRFLMDTRKGLDDLTEDSTRKTNEMRGAFLEWLGVAKQYPFEGFFNNYMAMVTSAKDATDSFVGGGIDPKPWYDYAQTAIGAIDTIESRVARWTPIDSYTEQEFLDVLGDWSAGLGEFVNDTRDKLDEAKEEYRDFVGDIADSFIDLADLEDDYADKQSDAWEKWNQAAVDAGDERADAEKSLTKKLRELEQDRADKIKWVRDGAWKRTAADEASAESWWSAEYDRKKIDIIRAYGEQVAEIEEGERKKQAAANKAAAEATAAYEKELLSMKLMAGLTILEINGMLPELFGGAVKTAEDAKRLIDANLIKIDPAGKLAQYLAAANEQFAQTQEDAKANTETNTQSLADIYSGKIETDINPATLSMGSAFDDTVLVLSEGAVAIGSAMDGVKLRIEEVKKSQGTLGPGFGMQSAIMLAFLTKIKAALTTKLYDPLELARLKTVDAAEEINLMYENTMRPLDELRNNLEEIQGALKNIEIEAENAGTAISDLNAQPPSQTGQTVITPAIIDYTNLAIGHANGGTFVVPPGYPNDSYPMLVESGEVVSVIPRNKVQGFAQGTGAGELAPIDASILNVWLPVAQAQFRKRLNKMFDMEPITEYFTELRDLQAQAAETEQEYQDVIAGIQTDSWADLKDERKDYNEKVVAAETDRQEKIESLEMEAWKDAQKHSEDLTAVEADRQEKIRALDIDAWGLTQEQYALELAAINATYDEKKRASEAAYQTTLDQNAMELAAVNAAYAEKKKAMIAAYKEQITIIKAAEAAKLAEEQAAYAKTQEEYQANLNHLKLVAGLSVLEMSGTLESFTNGWADTADEAASMIETGLLPISNKLAGALSTSMKGLVGTTAQADAALIKNNKVLSNIMAGNYTAMASPTAGLASVFQEFTGGTAEDTLKNTIGSIITSMTGDVRTFLEYFGVKDIDKLLGHFSSGGRADSLSTSTAGTATSFLGSLMGAAGFGSAGGVFAQAAGGADFIVPPGYARDTFPMYVSSGEHVQVTPAGQGGGRNTTINVTGNWNPQSEGDLMRYLKIINLMG